jgi:beta-phosphoglucomutase-like phosphatase (HAD superfamily)
VVIEDAPFGVRGAVTAGMRAYGYMGGSHVQFTHGLTDAELLYEGALYVYKNHVNLLDTLELN